MKKLSQDAESRLLAAVEKTAALVNDGDNPNDAIVKAAAEGGIPPGHISLLVHAYNTGRTTRQRQEGGDVFEKSADFDLADTATVLERLYATNVKTAAQIVRDTVVSLEYASPPSGVLARRELRQKQANVVDFKMSEPPVPYPTDPTYRLKKAYCDAERIKREIEEARREKQAAYFKMAETFESLADYFRSPSSTPIPVVREHVELLHGGKATELVDSVVRVYPNLTKMAVHQVQPSPYDLTTAVGEPYALVSEFLDRLDAYKQASARYDQVEKAGSERREALLRPFDHRPRSVLDDTPLSTKTAAGVLDTLAKGNLAAGLWDRVATGIKSPDGDKLLQRNFNELTDPDHEAKLRQIHTTALLQDLRLNDPIISAYDDVEQTQAFNDIVEASPRAANQKLLLQALMRQRLEQGHLDPFAVDQLVGTDNKMMKRDMPNMAATAGTPGGSSGSVLD